MDKHTYDIAGKRVWVAGHGGMVGSALMRRLSSENCELVSIEREKVDLCRQADVEDWMADARPHTVFVAAAKVGGILANDTLPADFLYENLMIEANIVNASHRLKVEKLLFLGSSCIYPRLAEQPLKENQLLTGPLESTNEWYAIAKIAGIKLCQAYRKQHGNNFISAMPTNLYGPGDNFNLEHSHVIPAIMRKMHDAKMSGEPSVQLWGTGNPRREFLHVDDLADALLFLISRYKESEHINVGTGVDLTIQELSKTIATVVGFEGQLMFDSSKPDGTPRKVMDVGRLTKLGWSPSTELENGLRDTYEWFVQNIETIRK